MVNYFEVLNVSENAENEVIHFAYKALAKKYHPDTTKLPNDTAEEKMALINEAYRILSDEVEREKYIKCLHSMPENRNKEDLREVNMRTGAAGTATYENNDFEFDKDSLGVMSYIIGGVIIISVICCMLYFGPDILNDAWNNIVNGFEKVVNTFRK